MTYKFQKISDTFGSNVPIAIALNFVGTYIVHLLLRFESEKTFDQMNFAIFER